MAMYDGEPSLAKIVKQSGGDNRQLLAILKVNIIALAAYLKLKNSLDEDDVDYTAEQIYENYGMVLNLADVYCVLRNAKHGKYGKFYERLSATDIITWFRDYYNERMDVAAEYNRRKDMAMYGAGTTRYREKKSQQQSASDNAYMMWKSNWQKTGEI